MKEIQLTKGKVALVDDEDFEHLNQWKWQWHKGKYTVYAMRSQRVGFRKRESILMHRQILSVTNPCIHIDHKDGNGLNNQKSNIRICDRSQNGMNQQKQVRSLSGFKGVTIDKHKKCNPWRARISVKGKYLFLGYYPTEKAAAIAYNKKAAELFGEFARPNVV